MTETHFSREDLHEISLQVQGDNEPNALFAYLNN